MSSRLILGTVQFGIAYGINNAGGKVSKEKVFEILRYALANHISQLDCADMYGDAQEIIGDFIRTEKKNFIVNTKFRVQDELSITKQLDHTLEQLSLDAVNVYFFHRFEEMKDHPEVLDELKALKEKKRSNSTGVSIYTNKEFEACIDHPEIDVIQLPFNLLDNDSKKGSLIRKAKQRGKTLQVRSVFLQGLFFKDDNSWPSYLQPLSKYVQRLKQLAAAYQLSMFDLALGYVIAKSDIDHIIIGVDSKEQLEKNLAAQKIIMDKDLLESIDAIHVEEESLLYPYNWK